MPSRKRGEIYHNNEPPVERGPRAAFIDGVAVQERYGATNVHVQKVEHFGAGKKRMATVSLPQVRPVNNDPAHEIAKRIREALDPNEAPRPVKSLKDMTPEEQAQMRKLYER